MYEAILWSLAICNASLLATLLILRANGLSLGLPFAYLFMLLLNHIPGAYAHIVRPDLFVTTESVALGFFLTAVGSASFSIGLFIGRNKLSRRLAKESEAARNTVLHSAGLDRRFWLFCLWGGWVFIYALSPLTRIPSLGALVEKGGALWMLGVMLGLRDASRRGDRGAILFWLSSLTVYPTLMLLLGGFLSYGSTAVIITLSILFVSSRSLIAVLTGIAVLTFVGLTIFTNYFIARTELRSVLWSGAGIEQRIDAVFTAFSSMGPLNLENDKHALALDARLNQNYFAGLAAENIASGRVDLIYGRSIYEALIAPIPRAIWPDKPVGGGSGTIVRDMTQLKLEAEHTSWGVGQVLEFYINFGWASLVSGFLGLGWLIGRLDIKAAIAARTGDTHMLLVCFLPAVALIQPIGSMVELFGGSAAAYFAALAWSRLWASRAAKPAVSRSRPGLEANPR